MVPLNTCSAGPFIVRGSWFPRHFITRWPRVERHPRHRPLALPGAKSPWPRMRRIRRPGFPRRRVQPPASEFSRVPASCANPALQPSGKTSCLLMKAPISGISRTVDVSCQYQSVRVSHRCGAEFEHTPWGVEVIQAVSMDSSLTGMAAASKDGTPISISYSPSSQRSILIDTGGAFHGEWAGSGLANYFKIQADTACAVSALAGRAAVGIPDFVAGPVSRLDRVPQNQYLVAADPALAIGDSGCQGRIDNVTPCRARRSARSHCLLRAFYENQVTLLARCFFAFFGIVFSRFFCVAHRFRSFGLIFRFGEVQRAALSAGRQRQCKATANKESKIWSSGSFHRRVEQSKG